MTCLLTRGRPRTGILRLIALIDKATVGCHTHPGNSGEPLKSRLSHRVYHRIWALRTSTSNRISRVTKTTLNRRQYTPLSTSVTRTVLGNQRLAPAVASMLARRNRTGWAVMTGLSQAMLATGPRPIPLQAANIRSIARLPLHLPDHLVPPHRIILSQHSLRPSTPIRRHYQDTTPVPPPPPQDYQVLLSPTTHRQASLPGERARAMRTVAMPLPRLLPSRIHRHLAAISTCINSNPSILLFHPFLRYQSPTFTLPLQAQARAHMATGLETKLTDTDNRRV